ncbi:toll-like receptor 13 isoform X1 [Nothobranchius furzeri]|uniref:Toll-like receptor 13 n=3 Tax=Nothobranchius furzeri TaxID=105023 RepID=A0A9D3BM53_NOTFU|nr:toll-like receptor 13 [Nothobranchius furzeri]
MRSKGNLSLLIFMLLFILRCINHSLAYFLTNCTMIIQETPSNEVALDCADRQLVAVPDDLIKDAVSVKLGMNRIPKINKGDFCDMGRLSYLLLYGNEITVVDDGSFTDLVLLKTLDISTNKLTNVTCNMFQGLSNLTMLDLSQNKIRFIHNAAFRFLISLQTLSLRYNKLQQICDIAPIRDLPQIQEVFLSCNLFSSFETKDLPQNFSSNLNTLEISGKIRFSISTPAFPYIKTLVFFACGYHNNLQWDIPDKALLQNITDLYLDQQEISVEAIQEILQSLDSLTHFNLSFFREWGEKGLLSEMCKKATLRSLNLFQRDLNSFTSQLASCSQLTKLKLEDTYLKDLPKGSILPMRKLRFLSVSRNELNRVPFDVKHLSSLETLRLRNNLISELSCEDFMNNTNLSELYLNANQISKVGRCVFESLTNLKRLDLSDNMLTTVTDAFNNALQKLEVLNLRKNFIKCIRNDYFRHLKSLKRLNIESYLFEKAESKAFNGLKNLEELTSSLPLEGFGEITHLQLMENLTIILPSNRRFTVSESTNDQGIFFKSMKSLTVTCKSGLYYFNMEKVQSMNQLEIFKTENVLFYWQDKFTFERNTRLKTLTLTKSDLSKIRSELLQPIPHLQILDLSQSKIKSLDFLMRTNLTELRYLILADNEIDVINELVFSSLPSLTYLDLSNNPLLCECSNSGFIQWVKNNKQTMVVNTHQYKCSFPVEKQGTKLLDFDIQPCLDDGSFFFFISSTCLVVLTLLTSFIYHFLKWQLVYTFHLFLAFLYDSRKGKKQDPHQFDAFVSYNVHDEDWVYREMLPVLEGEQGWRLCLHHRDFQPGKPIIENITDAIYGSRKTICVISRHYLQSEWCSREIQIASFRLFDEQKDVLILLFLEVIPSHHLSPHYRMRKLMKKRTYLSWPQAAQHPGGFWQKVKRALQTGDTLTENTDLLTGAMEH